MTQTTGAMNTVDGQIEYKLSGGSFVDISGFANKLNVATLNRPTGEKFTPDGDTPIVTAGKQQPIDISVDVLYTEGAAEPYLLLLAAFQAKTGVTLQWAPAGDTAGNEQYTSGAGYITSISLPSVDSEEAGPHAFSMTVRVPSISFAAIAA